MTYHQVTPRGKVCARRAAAARADGGRDRPGTGAPPEHDHAGVARNRKQSDGDYRPQLADWYACGRRSQSRRNRRFTIEQWALVAAFLWEQWSSEQVVGWLRLHGILRIRHETI